MSNITSVDRNAGITSNKSVIAPILGACLLGLALIFVAGHLQAHPMHDAAHDVRHTTGFPCH